MPVSKPTIRVTSLSTWQECRYKHHLSRGGWRLRPTASSGLSPQMSGTAIHFGIEAGLLAAPGRNRVAVAVESANAYLDHLGGDRYRQGVYTALQGVPQEVWDTVNPQSEQRITVEYDLFFLTGKPDLWTYTQDAIIITDFKSTSKDEQDRLEKMQLFNMQPRYYGVLLTAWLVSQGREPPPVYTRHLVLSTRGKHVYGVPQLLSEAGQRRTQDMMLKIGHEIAAAKDISFLDATVSASCTWCEYQDLCVSHLTDGDISDTLESQYRRTGDITETITERLRKFDGVTPEMEQK